MKELNFDEADYRRLGREKPATAPKKSRVPRVWMPEHGKSGPVKEIAVEEYLRRQNGE